MSPRRILITGAGGQVGREASGLFEGAGWQVIAHDRTGLDITDRSAVDGAVEAAAPAVVLNLAAYNAVDKAESDVDGAFAVNAMAVRHLAAASARQGARLCHVSTDYVFDGTSDRPYVEWDHTCPRSVYGRSKEAGEREAGPEALVVRTSWVCGQHGGNLVKTVLRLAEDPERELAFVTDQIGCPTMAADLAATLVTLISGEHRGIFHVTNGGAVSWYQFVQEILAAAGHSADRVRPITTAELDPPRPAPRPENSVLDGAALRLAGLDPVRHHAEALGELVTSIQNASSDR